MLDARELTVGYEDREILRNISLQLTRGQCLGLVGPNGSGKSTLVRALSRVLPPLAGQVLLEGTDLYRLPARAVARRLAVVPQDTTVPFDFSVRDIVLMGRAPHLGRFGMERPQDYARVEECLSLTHATALADRPITSLSGGERQRCMIARALAQEPEILLLDEPTAHLDINHQIEVLDLTRRLTVHQHLATLVVLHDLNLASQYCDSLVLLAPGRAVAVGSPREVVTERAIRQAYGAEVQVRPHPTTGRPYVTLLSRLPVSVVGQRPTRVHLICGAGTGTELMRALTQLGFGVSVGVVNVADSDQVEAEALALERVEEAPFCAVREESHRRNCELACAADVVVVTGIPFGHGNLLNLEAASRARQAGRRVLLIDEPPIAARDFTEGEAAARQQQVVEAGAEVCPSAAAARALLEQLP